MRGRRPVVSKQTVHATYGESSGLFFQTNHDRAKERGSNAWQMLPCSARLHHSLVFRDCVDCFCNEPATLPSVVVYASLWHRFEIYFLSFKCFHLFCARGIDISIVLERRRVSSTSKFYFSNLTRSTLGYLWKSSHQTSRACHENKYTSRNVDWGTRRSTVTRSKCVRSWVEDGEQK